MSRQSHKPVSLGRHKRHCTICAHPQCEEIERDFINWKSPSAITTEYGLGDRTTVYRHAHALDLFTKRGRNVRAALEKIIERVGEVDVTAGRSRTPKPSTPITAMNGNPLDVLPFVMYDD